MTGPVFTEINAATSGRALPSEEVNMSVCEKIKLVADAKVLAEVVKMLRKKVKASEHSTVMNTLVLMEVLMKNCSMDFHMAMSNKKLMKAMTSIIKTSDKTSDPVRREESDMCLKLIRLWGEAFGQQPHVGKVFVDTYRSLRKKGYSFPDTHSVEYVPNAPSRAPAAPQQSTRLNSLSPEERKEMVYNVAGMLTEILLNASTKEEVIENDLVGELVGQCNTFQNEIARMLSEGEDQDIDGLLALNEKVLNTLILHKRAVKFGPKSANGESEAPEKKVEIASGNAQTTTGSKRAATPDLMWDQDAPVAPYVEPVHTQSHADTVTPGYLPPSVDLTGALDSAWQDEQVSAAPVGASEWHNERAAETNGWGSQRSGTQTWGQAPANTGYPTRSSSARYSLTQDENPFDKIQLRQQQSESIYNPQVTAPRSVYYPQSQTPPPVSSAPPGVLSPHRSVSSGWGATTPAQPAMLKRGTSNPFDDIVM
eukprot:CAMPEP_0203763234 /NCGR_PEP_ID=MMETSP0098-20131031/15893_1 /ASSEMBLY_ACC=CAM_ASM_000208 /TAXON_ID=96639 /ORGANISM=" , Strain NY0313808BC1" /LENGTH=480 /DNA_ID=CAMNT_0050657867 /DNA_START=173 /DNA_END=1615 /DNA_ORIENTATION=-